MNATNCASASDILQECRPGCVERVVDAWYAAVSRINPILILDDVRTQLVDFTEKLVTTLYSEPFDPRPAQQIGSRMEILDTFQPQDVQEIQESLARVFCEVLPAEDWAALQPRVTRVLFSLAAGFYMGKSHRAAKFNVAATSRMGHDLKTPINTITGFSRVILKGIDGPITEFQREDLTSIDEAGQKLLTIINDLYAVKKRDAARTLVYGQPFQVSELLGDILYVAQPLAAVRDNEFVIRVVGDLGELDLDASKVRWLLLTLMCHAIRSTTNQRITLTAERDYCDGDWIVLGLNTHLPHDLQGRPLDGVAMQNGSVDESDPSSPVWTSEIGLINSRRTCEELRGSITRSLSERDGLTYTVRLPVSTTGMPQASTP